MREPVPQTKSKLSAAARKRVLIGGLVIFLVLMASPYISFLIGEILRGRYLYPQAIKFYEYSIWRGTVGADPYLAKAMCEYNTENYNDAIMSANRSIMRNPKSAVAYAERAFATIQTGVPDERGIAEARKLDPNIAMYYHQSAWKSIQDLADPRIALELENKATMLDPKLGKAYVNRAKALIDLGDDAGAIVDIDLAFDIGLPDKPAKAAALCNRALAELHLSDYEMAEFDGETAIWLDPYNDAGFIYKACALLGEYEYDKVLSFCLKNQNAHPWLENVRKMAAQRTANLAGDSAVKTLLEQIDAEERQNQRFWQGLFDGFSLLLLFAAAPIVALCAIARQRSKEENKLKELTDILRKPKWKEADGVEPQVEPKSIEAEPERERLDLATETEKIKVESS
jgi:tetratricopeptide (TPR) repeat protein